MNIKLQTLNIQLHPNGTVQTMDNSNLIRHITTDENNRLYVSKDNVGNTVSCLNQHGNLIPLDPQAVLTAQNNYLQVPVKWRERGSVVQFQENEGVWSNTLPHSLYTRTGLNPQNNVGRSHPPIHFNRHAAGQQPSLDAQAQYNLNTERHAWNQSRPTRYTTIHHLYPGVYRVPVAIGTPTWNGFPIDTSGRGVYTLNGVLVPSDYRIGIASNRWLLY